MSRHLVVDGVRQDALLWDECENFVILTYEVETEDGLELFEERGSLLSIVQRASVYLHQPKTYMNIFVRTQEQYAFDKMIEEDPLLSELAKWDQI